MAKTTKKNLPAKKSQEAVPDFFKKAGDLGVDSIDAQDINIPRIKICQKMSNVHEEIEKIKDGEIYNDTDKSVIGQSLNMVIVLHWKSWVWFSDDNKMRAVCFLDPVTKKEKWFGLEADEIRANRKKYEEEEMATHNYFLLSEEDMAQAVQQGSFPLPAIYSASSAANKQAKNLNSALRMNAARGIPIYGNVIEMTTKEEKFKRGSAFMPRFAFGRMITAGEFEFLNKYHAECKKLQSREEVHDTGTDFPAEEFENEGKKHTKL